MHGVKGIEDWVFRVIGQPNLNGDCRSASVSPRVTRSTSPTCRTRFRPPVGGNRLAMCCRASSAFDLVLR